MYDDQRKPCVVLVPFAGVDEVVRQERPLNFQRRDVSRRSLFPRGLHRHRRRSRWVLSSTDQGSPSIIPVERLVIFHDPSKERGENKEEYVRISRSQVGPLFPLK